MRTLTPRQLSILPVPVTGTVLCKLSEIGDPGAKGFLFGDQHPYFDLVVVRRGEDVYGYVNVCPHAGTPLEALPDRFLTEDRTELLCATHGARFRIEDGVCTDGPCQGQSLTVFPVHLEGDDIVVSPHPD